MDGWTRRCYTCSSGTGSRRSPRHLTCTPHHGMHRLPSTFAASQAHDAPGARRAAETGKHAVRNGDNARAPLTPHAGARTYAPGALRHLPTFTHLAPALSVGRNRAAPAARRRLRAISLTRLTDSAVDTFFSAWTASVSRQHGSYASIPIATGGVRAFTGEEWRQSAWQAWAG